MLRRERGVAQSLGGPLTKRIKDSRVLLVGAGGIGCELLKNLVCCGFGTSSTGGAQPDTDAAGDTQRKAEIVVIDLDTIDLSNLNRQFLFRKQHIKKPKAVVARETALQFNPAASIEAQHASVFDSQFSVEYFESFDIVFNALDNLEARRHVNRMCLAANVPLIESGTTGFSGQVQVIQKGLTECYDCNEKEVPKTYPTCTIRSTPSQPIHCIVWAKGYLLPELFGTPEGGSEDVQVTEGDDTAEVAKLREEAEALNRMRSLMGKPGFAEAVFNKVFHDDIERLKSMTEMWRQRPAPESLHFHGLQIKDAIKQGRTHAARDQDVWTLLENLSVFCYAIDALSRRLQAGEKVIEFDKDDKDTLDFVASAANIRAHIFHFPLHSEWRIKQMAGNIIPAIATSNAMTASLCVLQAFKVLRSSPPTSNTQTTTSMSNSTPAHTSASNGQSPLLGGAKTVYLVSRHPERTITANPVGPPKKDCPVCSPSYAKLVIRQKASPTLQDLVNLLRSQLKYKDLSITLGDLLVYDPDFEDNLEKSLQELGVKTEGNQFITVADEDDEKVNLMLSVTAQTDQADDNGPEGPASLRLVPGHIDIPAKPPKETQEQNGTNGSATADVEPSNTGAKRKRESDGGEETGGANKKAKADDSAITIEDDGVISLD